MRNLLKKEKGFTLIEIVLVLAIAGLILVIVFLAVSGAQKSRRDSQRKQDVARIEAALENFASNNNGNYPSEAGVANVPSWATFWANYVANQSNFKSPSTGNPYTIGTANTASATVTAIPALDTVNYADSGRTVQVCIGTEQGSDSCVTNQ